MHYFRAGQKMPLQTCALVFLRRTAAAIALVAALPACAQYPGQITRKDKDTPPLRAVAVLEWTGDLKKPKTSRLVPVCVYDGDSLQDGGVYLARPEPLAVDSGTEYELQKNGRKIGLFDLRNAGQEEGSWVGFGTWKALPQKPSTTLLAQMAQAQIDDEYGDRPVLHRKEHKGDSAAGKAAADKTGADKAGTDKAKPKDTASGPTAPAPDPDRPTLHRPAASQSETSQPAASEQTASAPAAPDDPDRPHLTKPRPAPKKTVTVGYVESLPKITDPERPRLMRGKPASSGPDVAPTLMGLPADMQQMVAVSDATNHPDHPWNFSWANPEDEGKMKAQMEEIAREALGLNTPPAAPSGRKTAAHKTATSKAAKARAKAAPPAPAEPAPLDKEQFRVFQLEYGSGATLVLTAQTGEPLKGQKFVALIAQPDLYGGLLVLMKNVTDSDRLDITPRMHLIDAVDAMADNRGELLFELRGSSQRRFALYRVLRGTAERIFVTGGGYFGTVAAN